MDLELWVGNLLARIFRDGGHHHAAVGTEQACKEADAILADCIVSGTLDLSHQKRILQGENAVLRQRAETAEAEGYRRGVEAAIETVKTFRFFVTQWAGPLVAEKLQALLPLTPAPETAQEETSQTPPVGVQEGQCA
jgi:hypothetical protein